MSVRVGFFGGSFDPPHLGHLGVARAARLALRLDRVLLAPVGAQPLKPDGPTAAFEDRVRMTELAIAGEPGLELSLLDAPRPGRPNYTVETLRRLGEEHGSEAELYCLMGADSFALLKQWRHAAEIPFRAQLVVASRPGERILLGQSLPDGVEAERGSEQSSVVQGIELHTWTLRSVTGQHSRLHLLPGVEIPISATEVRRRIASDERVEQLLPAPVLEYVRRRNLYK
jgi:nicotinate-nucleotide adenylyltransferase